MSRWDSLNPSSSSTSSSHNNNTRRRQRQRQRQYKKHNNRQSSSLHNQSFSSQRTTTTTTTTKSITPRSSSSSFNITNTTQQQKQQSLHQSLEQQQQQKWRRNGSNKLTTTTTVTHQHQPSLPTSSPSEQQKIRQIWQKWRDSCRKLHYSFQKNDNDDTTTTKTTTTPIMEVIDIFINDCHELLLLLSSSSNNNNVDIMKKNVIEYRFVDTCFDLALECLHQCYQIMKAGDTTATTTGTSSSSGNVINSDYNKRRTTTTTVDNIDISENDTLYRICQLITQCSSFSHQPPTTTTTSSSSSSLMQIPSDIRLTHGLSTLTSLLSTNQSSHHLLFLSTLSTILQHYTPLISPNTLHHLLSSIYIPSLTTTFSLISCQTLRHLFQHYKNQTRAILSPLVYYDISSDDDGWEWKEEYDVLGGRIVKSLMKLIQFEKNEDEDDVVVREACIALTAFLMIDDGEVRKEEEEVVLVMQRIVSFLVMDERQQQHQEEPRRISLSCHVLRLTSRLMISYPRVMISHWSSLLPTTTTTAHHNNTHHDNDVTRFDGLIFYWYHLNSELSSSSLSSDDDDTTTITIAAIEATESLLKVLPLRLWLGGTTTSTQGGGRQRPSSTIMRDNNGHLNYRVRTSLIRVIHLTTRYFSQITAAINNDDDNTLRRLASQCQFISTLFQNLPFDETTKNESSLTTPTIPLIHLLCTSMELHSSSSHQSMIQSALLTAIGGQMTPLSSHVTPSIPPLTIYLKTNDGCEVLERIFSDALFKGTTTPRILWRRLSKCQDWIYANREERFIAWMNDQNGEVMVDFVHDWLDGSKQSSSMATAIVNRPLMIRYIAPRLLQLVNDAADDTLKSRGLYSLALLTNGDWDIIATYNKNEESYSVMDYFNSFLYYCRHDDDGSFVRRAACKAVAEFGTMVVGGGCCSDETADEESSSSSSSSWRKSSIAGRICREISETMTSVVGRNDVQEGVRGMALFAMGNLVMALASSLRQKNDDDDDDGNSIDKLPLPQECFREMVDCCCHSLNDKDDKVITNAIRTMGHLANLSQHHPQTYPLYYNNSSTYNTILLRLSHFIATSLSYTSYTTTSIMSPNVFCPSIIKKQQQQQQRREPTTPLLSPLNPLHLTSKKRVHLKKHAWGSCRSLSHLLNCHNAATAMTTTIINPSNITTLTTIPNDKNNNNNDSSGSVVIVTSIKNALHLLIQCLEKYNILHEKIWMEAMNSLLNVNEDTWRLGEKERRRRQRNDGDGETDFDDIAGNEKGSDDDDDSRSYYYDNDESLLGQCLAIALIVCNNVSRNSEQSGSSSSRRRQQKNNNNNTRQRQSLSFFSKNSPNNHHRGTGGKNTTDYNKSQPTTTTTTTTTNIAVVQQQVNMLLMRLLQFVTSWNDFNSLLLYELSSHFDDDDGDSGGGVLEFFYHWLVDRSSSDCSSTSMTTTATAREIGVVSRVFSFVYHAMRRWEEESRRRDNNGDDGGGDIRTTTTTTKKEMDVRLVQKFASRALREERKKKHMTTIIGGVSDDNGAGGGGVDIGVMDSTGFRRRRSNVADNCADDGDGVLTTGESSIGGDIIVLTADDSRGYYHNGNDDNGDDEL